MQWASYKCDSATMVTRTNTIATHATISIDQINAMKDAHGHSYRAKKNLCSLYMYEIVG